MGLFRRNIRLISLIGCVTEAETEEEANQNFKEKKFVIMPGEKQEMFILEHDVPLSASIKIKHCQLEDVSDSFEYMIKYHQYKEYISNKDQLYFEFYGTPDDVAENEQVESDELITA